MYIKKITIQNFGSYYGERVFDFDTGTGRHGYAIFGEIGRGKTTLVESVLWCLYGRVVATKVLDGKQLKKNRPLIDASQMTGEYTKKWYLPLLNFQAWYNSDFQFSVKIDFEHNNRNYTLLRDASCKISSNPRTDKDMNNTPHLSVDGKTVNADLISKHIEEIIPERIARFFFVEVDSIMSYSALLDADGSVGGIVDDIEAILGMPALDHSKSDFKSLEAQNKRSLENLVAIQSGNKKIIEQLKDVDAEIDALEKEQEEYKDDLEKIRDKIQQIDIKLSEHVSVETHMQRLKEAETKKKNLETSMKEAYRKRREALSGNAWRFLLQSKLEAMSARLKDKVERTRELERQKSGFIVKKEHLEKEIHKGGAECEACGFVTEGITPLEKDEKAKKVIELENEIGMIEKELEILGNPSDDALELSRYRDSSKYSEIKTLETKISMAEMDINTEEKKINEISKALHNSEVLAVRGMQYEKEKLIKTIGKIEDATGFNLKLLNQLRDERAKGSAMLETNMVESPQINQYQKLTEIFGWLEKTFEIALTNFKHEARESVESFATEAWLKMIPEPEKYHRVRINSSWNTEVISKTGKPLPIANPGHRQTLSVCLFDGLRKTSRRRFPTFFDNPGSNIGEYTLDKMASHFWDDAKDQIVMLSHGGGLKQEETMSKYGSKLARAWELYYPPGDEVTTNIRTVSE